ncbi:MAG: thermonuclease family protein [Planctomycetes bacterium]|nr:thermonuclease family protein [Planctomycetota bacterium]
MNSPDPAQSAEPQEQPASGWHKYNLLDLRFAGMVVAVIGLIVWLSWYHKHTYFVEAVQDGDTIVVSKWGRKFLVQLAGADAPEIHKNEPFAEAARTYLVDRLLGRKIWLDDLDSSRKLDYKDRLLCWAWIDGENISYMLVGEGYAKFSGTAEGDQRTILSMLEADAKEHRRGLWSAEPASD